MFGNNMIFTSIQLNNCLSDIFRCRFVCVLVWRVSFTQYNVWSPEKFPRGDKFFLFNRRSAKNFESNILNTEFFSETEVYIMSIDHHTVFLKINKYVIKLCVTKHRFNQSTTLQEFMSCTVSHCKINATNSWLHTKLPILVHN
jgi:hypothetical protein